MPAESGAATELAAWAASSDIDYIGPEDGGRYDAARRVFNRMHDRFPSAVVAPASVRQVQAAVERVRSLDLPMVVRGGGHHIAGSSTCDGGVVIDLRRLDAIEHASVKDRCWVGGGARLRHVDAALCSRGVVVPAGTVSDTGIGGLALGGGIGWMVGRAGLTCDNIVGADVVLADGSAVTICDDTDPDLLWALRGGGGGLGIVTRFLFRTHELPPVTVGEIRVSDADARGALLELVDFLAACPRALTVAPTLVATDGRTELLIEFCLCGADVTPLRELRRRVSGGEFVVERNADFRAWQRHTDAQFAMPLRGYWKSSYTAQLGADEVDAILDAARDMPTPRSSVLIEHLHGAFHDEDEHTSAFPLRWASFGVLFSARWEAAADDVAGRAWARESVRALDPNGRGGSYSNYTSADDPRALADFARTQSIRDRLTSVKRRVDPTGIFGSAHLQPPIPVVNG